MKEPIYRIEKKPLAVVEVLGHPKGQPRPRAFSRNGRAAVYDAGTAEGWKSCVAAAAMPLAGQKVKDPLSITLTFFLPRPKSHLATSGQLKKSAPRYLCVKKPDVDNLAKAVLDCLTEIGAWQDDDQVAELIIRKYWESDHNGKQTNPPGCIIRIATLNETSE